MIKHINTLPNYCNGKLYKNWNSVKTLFGENTILASKVAKNNTSVQLLISDGGKKRELLYENGKVMNITDSFGNKRTYIYEKLNKDTIKGRMFSTENSSAQTLVLAAKWFLENFNLKKLFITLNPAHKNSNIFIPAKHLKYVNSNEYFGMGKSIHVEEILAKDFEEFNPEAPLPRTVVLKTKDGIEIIEAKSAQDNYAISKSIGIISDELGNNLRTIV